MKFSLTRVIGTLLVATVFAGCSSAPPQIVEPSVSAPPPGWQQQYDQLLALESWALQGKIGIRTADDSASAGVSWKQQQDRFNITLAGPFGQGATISGSRRDATLEVSGQQPISAGSPEELLAYQFGWEFPVQAARYWVKGAPAPESSYQAKFNSQGLAELDQNGWHIQYRNYVDNGQLKLPTKVVLTRDELKLTLLVRNWQKGL